MKPSLFLGIDKAKPDVTIQNQLKQKRDQIAKKVSPSQLKKFDLLLQRPFSWNSWFAWGDDSGIWIGSREDFDEHHDEIMGESSVDKTGHMKLSPKQQRIAALAGNKKKIDAPDFAALRKGKKPCGCGEEGCPECKKSAVESKAHKVVNQLIGEAGDLELLAVADPDMVHDLAAGAADEMDHEETDMSNPEERTEVDIAHEILDVLDNQEIEMEERHATIRELAHDLLAMHGQDGEGEEPGEDFEELPGEGEGDDKE